MIAENFKKLVKNLCPPNRPSLRKQFRMAAALIFIVPTALVCAAAPAAAQDTDKQDIVHTTIYCADENSPETPQAQEPTQQRTMKEAANQFTESYKNARPGQTIAYSNPPAVVDVPFLGPAHVGPFMTVTKGNDVVLFRDILPVRLRSSVGLKRGGKAVDIDARWDKGHNWEHRNDDKRRRDRYRADGIKWWKAFGW